MLGFLIYLPTLIYIPHEVFLLAILYFFFRGNIYFSRKIKIDLVLIIAIIVLCIINRIIFHDKIKTLSDYIPYQLLILVTYFIAIKLKTSDLKILIYFIVIECLFVFIEYFSNINTIFYGFEKFEKFDSGALLYFKRPFGLSDTSSIIAEKALIGLLLIEYLKLNTLRYIIFRFVFILTGFLCFNRSVMIIIGLYYIYIILWQVFLFIRELFKNRIQFSTLFFIFIIFIVVSMITLMLVIFHEMLIEQFTRKLNKFDLSGREIVFPQFFSFIKEHFLFGNGSYKYIVPYIGKMAHAHNSFLQILADHGIVISLLYIFIIIRKLNKHNIVFVVLIFIYSIANYAIFWGISLMDIILFIIIFNKNIYCKIQQNDINYSLIYENVYR
ncbi:MAG: O-antigen ligase family protein [Bacteroidia bacterium]|nr:O-antigen ligase family protein [Bacteroidia bacterium]